MFWTKRPTQQQITDILKRYTDDTSISGVVVQGGHILATLEIDPSRYAEMETKRIDAEKEIRQLKGVDHVQIILTAEKQPDPKPAFEKPPAVEQRAVAPDVTHIIAVASGKGGVGKSTVAVNLAIALKNTGLSVGLLDADVYGPSVPMLLGLRDKKPEQENDYLIPLEAHGLKVMSMGFLVKEDAPMVWRGPMVQSALLQMLRDVKWGKLDVLVIDMPPGTGDTQLTIAQRVKLAGAVIVSTPQDVALLDTVKGVHMFEKVAVPIFGIIENMSYFCCPNCGTNSDIFGTHGARDRAAELKVDFLGGIPLDISVRKASDQGNPVTLDRTHAITGIFNDIALTISKRLNGRSSTKPAPRIIIE